MMNNGKGFDIISAASLKTILISSICMITLVCTFFLTPLRGQTYGPSDTFYFDFGKLSKGKVYSFDLQFRFQISDKDTTKWIGYSDKDWASLEPTEFVVEPKEAKEITLYFDTNKIYPDNYTVLYTFQCLSMENTFIYAECVFTLEEGKPKLSVDQNSIHFGDVLTGDNKSIELTASNTGTKILHGSVEIDASWITVNTENFSINEESSIKLKFTAQTNANMKGFQKAYIQIKTDGGTKNLYASINILPKKAILDISPTELDFGNIQTDDKVEKYFSILNIGNDVLHISDIQVPNWLEVDRNILDIYPDQKIIVKVNLITSVLKSGLYEDFVTILSNDKTVRMYVRVNIQEVIPKFSIDIEKINFGSNPVGSITDKQFSISNLGDANTTLEIGFSNIPSYITITPLNCEIVGGDLVTFSIQFIAPKQSIGEFSDLFNIRTNDPNNENVSIELSFTIIRGDPVCEIKYEKTSIFLQSGDTEIFIVTFANTGPINSLLEIEISSENYWVILPKKSISLESNNKETLKLIIDGTKLPPGIYAGKLQFDTNDPINSHFTLPLFVEIAPVDPVVLISPDSITKTVVKNLSCGASFSIENTGNMFSLLTCQIVQYPDWITIDSSTINLKSKEKILIQIQINSKNLDVGVHKSSIHIQTNDPNNENFKIPVMLEVLPIQLVIKLQIGSYKAEVFSTDKKKKDSIALDTPPSIVNNRTVVPLRFLAETFGAKVEWFSKEEEIQLRYENMLIHLWLHRKFGRTYDALIERVQQAPEKVQLETPPCIINGRTMVPLRFIGETFGAKVEWEADTQTIIITRTLK